MPDRTRRDARHRRYWDDHAASYDATMARTENRYLASSRPWLCRQSVGATLEVAVGTGRNFAFYPADVRLSGLERSVQMLEVARRRAEGLGLPVDLHHGDAHALPYPDASFDTVVCTYALCGIRDDAGAVAEMARVLKPGGLLLLADHVGSSVWPVRVLQLLVDLVSIPLQGEHYRRRPLRHVRALGFDVERHERISLGIIERFSARKPIG
jgi:ubiquinone/menaquinone biosynthesis C-methylase UbiE